MSEQPELKQMMGGLLELADTEAKKSDSYKALFEADSLDGVLRQAEREMTATVLNVSRVLKSNFGYEKTPDEAYYFLLALPLMKSVITKHIVATEGHGASVDKAFYLLCEQLRQKMEPSNE